MACLFWCSWLFLVTLTVSLLLPVGILMEYQSVQVIGSCEWVWGGGNWKGSEEWGHMGGAAHQKWWGEKISLVMESRTVPLTSLFFTVPPGWSLRIQFSSSAFHLSFSLAFHFGSSLFVLLSVWLTVSLFLNLFPVCLRISFFSPTSCLLTLTFKQITPN